MSTAPGRAGQRRRRRRRGWRPRALCRCGRRGASGAKRAAASRTSSARWWSRRSPPPPLIDGDARRAGRQRVVERELEVGRVLGDGVALDADARGLGGAHGLAGSRSRGRRRARRRVSPSAAACSRPESAAITKAPAGSGPTSAASGAGPPLTTRARPAAAAGDSTRRVCQDRGVLVVTLGDLLLDVVVRLEAPPAPDDDVPAAIALVPGGQAANVAAWVCWLGGEARLIARRADDAAGRVIAAEMERLGVELAGPVVAGERTGTVVALVAPDGARTLASDRGASGELGPDDVDEQHAGRRRRPARRRLHAAARAGRRGGAAARAGGPALRCSRDRRPLDGARHRSSSGATRCAARVAALAPGCRVRERGRGRGVRGADRRRLGGQARRPRLHRRAGRRGASRTPPVAIEDVVDTTGAGDAFAAGYLLESEPLAGGPARPGSRGPLRDARRGAAVSAPLRVAPEVADALARGGPVVCLETTLVAHGFPQGEGYRRRRVVRGRGARCGRRAGDGRHPRRRCSSSD